MSTIVFKYRKADSTSFVLKCIYQERRSENLRLIQLLQYTFVYNLFGGTFAKCVSHIKRLKVKQY